MNDMHPEFPHDANSPPEPTLDPALRALASRLDAAGAQFASERPGMAGRIFAASAQQLVAPVTAGRIGAGASAGASASGVPSILRPAHVRTNWGRLAAAASIAAAALVGVLLLRPVAPERPTDVMTVSRELPASGRSERLLVALFDSDAALVSSDPTAGDGASALAIIRGHNVDDVAVELDELLAVGGAR